VEAVRDKARERSSDAAGAVRGRCGRTRPWLDLQQLHKRALDPRLPVAAQQRAECVLFRPPHTPDPSEGSAVPSQPGERVWLERSGSEKEGRG
jgi:hypothetical protein